jgi:hypothetical protein
MSSPGPSLFDRSIKVLLRRAYPAFLRLAGVAVDPARVRPEDVTINLPEHRADQVFLVGEEGDPDRGGLHVECQLQPDTRVMDGWFYKNGAFNRQYGFPVPLVVIYLTRGDRATFPDRHVVAVGGVTNEWKFHTIRLWEHADRIRGGELAELAPLLVLCEDSPTEETLREERRLILGLDVPSPVRADLLAVAVMVGYRYFARELLLSFFREELQMLKEAGFVEEWLEEAEARGEARGAQRILLAQLEKQFGELPASVVERIEQADRAECEALALRVLDARSLDELGLAKGDVQPEV